MAVPGASGAWVLGEPDSLHADTIMAAVASAIQPRRALASALIVKVREESAKLVFKGCALQGSGFGGVKQQPTVNTGWRT